LGKSNLDKCLNCLFLYWSEKDGLRALPSGQWTASRTQIMEKQMTINRAFLILLAVLLLPSLAWAQTDTRATFNVTKDFTDNNDAVVGVQIDCNSGQILDQDKDISEGQGVQFVLTEFTAGLPTNCSITEDDVTGYSVTYDGCDIEDVDNGGDYNCTITNDPDPVEVRVNKEWVIEGEGGDALDDDFAIRLSCDDTIIYGYYSYGRWRYNYYGSGDDYFTVAVIPNWDGGTDCDVEETVYDSSVESDSSDCNGSDGLHVEIAQGDSCTVINSVFYEGIPTLSQYGMAILALLMLGVGFVGFRRFV
jgi:hypothetical protein